MRRAKKKLQFCKIQKKKKEKKLNKIKIFIKISSKQLQKKEELLYLEL